MEHMRGLGCGFFVFSAVIGMGLAVASTALASDGVIEINQAKVVKAGGFPYVISKAGSYRLTSNLDVTVAAGPKDTDAIDVNADNVTIDLNGFSILGPAVCSGGPPVTSCANTGTGNGVTTGAVVRNSVAVRNGTIRGMGSFGISGGGTGTIERLRAESNGGNGIYLSTGVVANCEASMNGADGIQVLSGGTIAGSVAWGNKGDGIEAVFATVTHTAANQNGRSGIFLGDIGVASNNTMYLNTSVGLSCNGGGYMGNVLSNNNGGGAQQSSCLSLGPNMCNGVLCP